MKSALARAGSMSKLRGPRSLGFSDGSPQKQTPKSVKFDKTDEVIHYDVMTPEMTEEYWDQISLQSCDSDIADRGGADGRPLPAVPQIVLPSTLLRNEPASPLQSRRSLMASPIAAEDEDEFDFSVERSPIGSPEAKDPDDVELPEPLTSPQIPEPVLSAPSMSARIDAMMNSGSGMSPSLRGSSGHSRTDSQLSELSEASAPYLPLRSPQRYKPEDDEEDPAKWRDTTAVSVARQDSLQDNQRHPPTKKVSDSELPPPADLNRTYSKRRKELATMLDPRSASSAHAVDTIPEEAEESDIAPPSPPKRVIDTENDDFQDDADERNATSASLEEHEVAPLLAEESQFIYAHPSIPQSSSEVLQNNFDFGDDSYWHGGYLKNLRDDSPNNTVENFDESEDTANATIGISNEPAAQYAAGVSPTLPDYSVDDETDAQVDGELKSDTDLELEREAGIQTGAVSHEDVLSSSRDESESIAREHSYLNIKDLGAEDLDIGPTLAPIRSDSDFFTVPSSPERRRAASLENEELTTNVNTMKGADEATSSSTIQQSTPQRQNGDIAEERTGRHAIEENFGILEDPATISTSSHESDSEKQSRRTLPETPPAKTVPPVRVLPWDPSIEDFQTSPIPVPDRSPKRQPSPQKGEDAKRDSNPLNEGSSYLIVPSRRGSGPMPINNVEEEDDVDAELRDLLLTSSAHSSMLKNEEEQVIKQSSPRNVDEAAERPVGSDERAIDKPVNDASSPIVEQHQDSDRKYMATRGAGDAQPMIALSPVSFNPFVPSLPLSPVESSLKEPVTPIFASGIDEIVSSPVINHLEPDTIPTSPRNAYSPEAKAKKRESDDSNTSVAGDHPHLDSDLSDFEGSPVVQDGGSAQNLSRQSIDNRSAWESVDSPSTAEPQLSSSPPEHASANLQPPPPQPTNVLPLDRRTHAAQSSITDDVSLREPSFGESMSSTLQHMLSQRSDLESDTLERSYTLREYGSYVVATSPVRRQRRSQVLEVIRDEDGSSYTMQQMAIPRNRPLASHSSITQEHRGTGMHNAGSQDNVRAPSLISRTDSSSYSFAIPSSSSQLHSSLPAKAVNAGAVVGEAKLGPIFEPSTDYTEEDPMDNEPREARTVPASPDQPVHSFVDLSHSAGEVSEIAASSSKTGQEVQMLDHPIVRGDDSFHAGAKVANNSVSEVVSATQRRYEPTIFPEGVLFFVVKGINIGVQLPSDTSVTLTLDNGVHCVTSAPRKLSEIDDFGEEYRIGILEVPLALTVRLCSPSGPVPVPELELGADGSFARLEMGNLLKQAFGKRRDLTMRGINHWVSRGEKTVCSADVAAMYIPCVSPKERLPGRLNEAAQRLEAARTLLREKQARMQGVLRQYGGDVVRHHGKQRWFVLDPVAPLLVAHSLRSHKARTLVNLAKATSAAQVDSHKLEIRFRNQEVLMFQVQSTFEMAAWLRALRGCIGNDETSRPKWIDAVIYESENGDISA